MFGITLAPIVAKLVIIGSLVLVILGGLTYVYKRGYDAAEREWEVKVAQYKQEQRDIQDRVIAQANAERVAIESDLQTRLLESTVEKEREIKNLNDRYAAVIDGLRKRPSRVSSPNPTPSPAAAAPTPKCAGTGGTGEGLSREDAEFLAGEAASADTLRRALKQCRDAYDRAVEGTYKKP